MTTRGDLVQHVVADVEWQLEDVDYIDFNAYMDQAKVLMRVSLDSEGACRDKACSNCVGILAEVVETFSFRHRVHSLR